jgi:hypothetical protein
MAKSRTRSESAQSTQTLEPGHDSNGNGAEGDNRHRIAQRAYELYLSRGGAHGGDFDDWLAAERELTGSAAQTESDRGE